MFPVAATAAGWPLLFFVLLALPPAAEPRRDEGAAPTIEPPAVVSLLARRLDRDGFAVTLADLAPGAWGVPAACGIQAVSRDRSADRLRPGRRQGPAGPGVHGTLAQVDGDGYHASFRILILINVD